MSRGGENSRRQKRRWVLRCRRGIKLALIRNEKPSVFLGLSSDWGRRLAELEGMPCSSVSPAGFGGVNFPLPWTREEFFSCRRRIFSHLPFAKGGFLFTEKFLGFIKIDHGLFRFRHGIYDQFDQPPIVNMAPLPGLVVLKDIPDGPLAIGTGGADVLGDR